MSEKKPQGNKRLQLAFAVAVLIGAIILLVAVEWGAKPVESPPPPPAAPQTGSNATTPPSSSAASPSQGVAPTPASAPAPVVVEPGPTPTRAFFATPTAPPPPEERSALADALNTPATTGRQDLEIVASVLSAFTDHFRELPIGNNAEITAALAGDNTRGIALLPADHPAINAQGELVDRWGSPYFFHQIGEGLMQIRSAGPDRRLYSDDDLIVPKPEEPTPDSDPVP